MTHWQKHLKKHKGQGYTLAQLSAMYRKDRPEKASGTEFTVVFRPKDPRSKAMARRITLKASGFKDAIKKAEKRLGDKSFYAENVRRTSRGRTTGEFAVPSRHRKPSSTELLKKAWPETKKVVTPSNRVAYAIVPLPRDRTSSGGPITEEVRKRHAARVQRGARKYWVVTMWLRGTTGRSHTHSITARDPGEAARKIQAKAGKDHAVVKVQEVW